MKLITSAGKTYEVQWVGGPTLTSSAVMIQMADDRRLPEIAAEFDGLEAMQRESETQGNKAWQGYTVLQRIARVSPGVVLLALSKEG